MHTGQMSSRGLEVSVFVWARGGMMGNGAMLSSWDLEELSLKCRFVCEVDRKMIAWMVGEAKQG